MTVTNLTKQYDGKTVVDGVTFQIPKGKVLSLIGPNGAGKSTVMGIISRLIARDAGLVDFEGQDITKWKSKELSKRLAILTQSNQIQMKLTVRELVAFGRFLTPAAASPPRTKRSSTRPFNTWSWRPCRTGLLTSCPAGSGSGP